MKKLIVILFMAIGFVFMFLITYIKFQSVEYNNFQETDSLLYSLEEPTSYD
jgi:hypothetical protein